MIATLRRTKHTQRDHPLNAEPNEPPASIAAALASIRQGSNSRALDTLASRASTPDPHVRVAQRILWAESSARLGNLSKALNELDVAEAEASVLESPLLSTRVRTVAASILVGRGRTTEALTSALEALTEIDDLDAPDDPRDRSLIAAIRSDIGELMLELGVPAQAIDQIRQAISHDRDETPEVSHRIALGRAQLALASRQSAFVDRRWERSARIAADQAQTAAKAGGRIHRVEAAILLAEVALLRSDPAGAGRLLVDAMDELAQIDDTLVVARHELAMAKAMCRSGFPEDAIGWLEGAQTTARRRNPRGLIADIERELAQAHRDLGDHAGALAHLERAFALESQRSNERVGALVTHLVQQTELATEHRRLVRTSNELADQARLDRLTDVPNRLALSLFVAELATGDEAEVAALFIDIDNFKIVNDTGGHGVGDTVLRSVAEIVKNTIRADDQVFRYGGDEFVVLLPGTDSAVAHEIAERIRASVERSAVEAPDADGSHLVTVSVGCCVGAGVAAASTIAGADAAVYLAKRSGRNRVAVAAPRAPMTI